MKKKSISIIIGLMSFALLGVVAMQSYFLIQSYRQQSQLFGSSVNEALNNVVYKLTQQDALNFLSKKTQQHDGQNSKAAAKPVDEDIQNTLFEIRDPSKTLAPRNDQLTLLRDSLKRMILAQKLDDELSGSFLTVRVERYVNDFGDMQFRFTPILVKNPNASHTLHKYDTIRYEYSDAQFGSQALPLLVRINPQWKAQQVRLAKIRQIKKVEEMLKADPMRNSRPGSPAGIQSLVEEYQRSDEPLKKRISTYIIDSLLRIELANKGIPLPYNYEVSTTTDSVIFYKTVNNKGGLPVFNADNTYQTRIFNKDVINDPGLLKISFPQKNSLILSHMTVTVATTAGLLLVLIICFSYTIFSIIRQKKISQMKTDFINNMTHEFKTPVSTIMIASDALRDAEITDDKNRVTRLANIIYEENARLGSHIERVLNVAKIDNNDFKLDKKPVDINEMVSLVVDSMELKLKKSEAQVHLNLDATRAVITADELHFSNVLYNLIDNAIKYSKDQPDITISTQNKNGHVIIKVMDKGIGMSRDQQTRIFEQFYRIPTGNLHDVKGFGLGLSYVNTIVKRLNGTIGVRSEKDKGSEFELKFATS